MRARLVALHDEGRLRSVLVPEEVAEWRASVLMNAHVMEEAAAEQREKQRREQLAAFAAARQQQQQQHAMAAMDGRSGRQSPSFLKSSAAAAAAAAAAAGGDLEGQLEGQAAGGAHHHPDDATAEAHDGTFLSRLGSAGGSIGHGLGHLLKDGVSLGLRVTKGRCVLLLTYLFTYLTSAFFSFFYLLTTHSSLSLSLSTRVPPLTHFSTCLVCCLFVRVGFAAWTSPSRRRATPAPWRRRWRGRCSR